MFFRQPINSIIALTHPSQITADSISDVRASDPAGFVNFSYVDLDRGVVFDADEFAGGGAFSLFDIEFAVHFFYRLV